MSPLDVATLVAYFAVVTAVGFALARRAARDLDSYFLGGRRLHWLALAMSGSVSNFDITGTMWIVSLLFVLGMKSMWVHWMWGVLLGAFFLAYMGKWVRRSGVMTAAEWMTTRFGDGRSGRCARAIYAGLAVLVTASAVGYAYQGIGKFAAVWLPIDADVLAVGIIGLTTLYVVLGGLYSVVVTDVIQTVVLSFAGLYVAWLAWARLEPGSLAGLPDGFASLAVPWELPELAGTDAEEFRLFGALVVLYVVKGLLLNLGGPGQMYDFQRFLAARDARDAAKVGAAWSAFLVVRWGMCMGIALLAVTGVAGVSDPEQVMPIVLRDFLPSGIRGLVVAGLLAAFMSTFSSTVNSGAAFVVRDLWQAFLRPRASERETVVVGYAATVLLVAAGIAIGYRGESIHAIWQWIMMALTAGVVLPNVLRWYWWRLNGWGYAAGTMGGVLASVIALLWPGASMLVVFPTVTLLSLVLSVAASLLTAPTERGVLVSFYVTVRPFGAWGPVRRDAPPAPRAAAEGAGRALGNTVLGMVAISGGYLFPMYLVGHWYANALVCLAAACLAIAALRITWYRHLPGPGE